jgi:hypothetical protein
MARSSRITNSFAIEPRAGVRHLTLVAAFLLCLGSTHGWAEQGKPQQEQQTKQQAQQSKQQPPQKNDQKQMRGLDEQIQEIKSDVLSISAELSLLEEKLLFPSGTEVAIFVLLSKGDPMRLDAVRLQIDGKPVASYIYSFKELEALRKGGVQRIYVGNVATGDHQLEVVVEGKQKSGADFSRTEHFAFSKDVKPKLVGLTLAGPDSGSPPIALGAW